jgi:hypothetical protein
LTRKDQASQPKADARHESGGAAFPLRRRTGLLLQIAVLLTVAIIPVGMVAVVQTQRAIDAAQRIYLDSLRAQTMEAATPEREGIMRALGVARSLSDAIAVLGPDAEACRQLMQRSAATNQGALFVGLIVPPGVSSCNNLAQDFDFTGNAASTQLFADPKATCASIPQATSAATRS